MQTTMSSTLPPRRSWLARLSWRFVSWFLELLYTELAWAYDLVANVTSVGQWWHWQEAVIDELPPGRLLELGFGTGRLLSRLASEGRLVYGLDRSPQMIEITRARIRQLGTSAPLVHGDALQMPFTDESFAAVYATFPSDYFFKDRTIREIRRVLQEEGAVVFIPFAVIRGKSLLDRAAALLYRITGQAPATLETTWLENATLPGFDMDYERVEQERASVLRVTLKKTS